MLTLCPSSAPSETGLCLSGGWLLNQTLTFSFLRHEVCQMHKFFSFLYKPQCLYCTPYHIFTHSERRPAVSIQRKTKKWLSIIVVLCETGGPSLHFWQQAVFFSATTIETMWKKWIDEWIEGEGEILIMFYELASLTCAAMARSCHLCFVPRSSITTLMSKVTINLSIKSKTNKRQKMMHHPNAPVLAPPPIRLSQTKTMTTE